MRIIFRFIVVLVALLASSQPVGAQTVRPGNLPVGSGPGQIGLVMAPNEECHGPAAMTPASGGRLALLDRVNNKIVVLGEPAQEDIPLPADLLEPSDFIATSRGYLVVGALGDVVVVDARGYVIARAATRYDPEKGAVRLVALPEGRFALENLRGERIAIGLGPAQTGELVEPGMAAAGTYRRSQDGATEAVLRSDAASGPLASIGVKSGIRIVDARAVWASDGEGALIAVQESRRLPEESAVVRLVAVNARGQPAGEAYLSPDAFACDMVRPYARLTDGSVVSLEFGPRNELRLAVLAISPTGIAKPKPLGPRGEAAQIIEYEDQLRALERKNGTTSVSKISLSPISRKRILERARVPLELKWRLKPSSYSHPGVANRCAPPEHIWRRPKRLDGMLNLEVTAIPYRWGGYMASVDTFSTHLGKGRLAGDDCICRKTDCVYPNATGMDCSGFVSYAWRAGAYFTTARLPDPRVSRPVAWGDLAPGDIVNKAGNHVRLVEAVSNGPGGPIVTTIESTSKASCGGLCRRDYLQTAMQLSGYKPLRRRELQKGD